MKQGFYFLSNIQSFQIKLCLYFRNTDKHIKLEGCGKSLLHFYLNPVSVHCGFYTSVFTRKAPTPAFQFGCGLKLDAFPVSTTVADFQVTLRSVCLFS